MYGYKLTKPQATKILNHFRSEKHIKTAELLRMLNSEERFEIGIESGAKVCGKNWNYFLRVYAEDRRDGKEAMALIGKNI